MTENLSALLEKARELRSAFEDIANEMYGGDATKFLEWTEEFGGEYKNADVNAAFRAFIEGYRLAHSRVQEALKKEREAIAAMLDRVTLDGHGSQYVHDKLMQFRRDILARKGE